MTGKNRKYALGAAVSVLGFLAVACGTAGENTGFRPPVQRGGGQGAAAAAAAGPGVAAAAAAGVGSGTGNLTGGIDGTAIVNTAFPATVATGLVVRNSLPANDIGGASNAATRLAMGDFGATLGRRAALVQGFKLGVGQGRVTLLPQNPGDPPGTGNVVLTPPLAFNPGLFSPFALAIPAGGGSIFVTDGVSGGLNGRLVRIDNIQDNGAATFTQVGPTNLISPLDVVLDGDFALVCEFSSQAGGGGIRRIDLTNGTATPLVTGLNFPSSMVIDNNAGRRVLYVTENLAGFSGAQGGVLRINLNDPNFVLGGGPVANSAYTPIAPQVGDPQYSNPFDLAIDPFGNIVVTEGLTLDVVAGTFTAAPGNGRIRVIRRNPAVDPLTSNTSRMVLTGLTGTRGPSLIAEDATGDANSVFFVEGAGLATSLRQLTFRNTDGGIFRHLILDQGQQNPLDTLFDPGSATPLVPTNVKYTIQFNGGAQGAVRDIR